MGQIFVSYRHVTPDENLAMALVACLERRNHRVFIDTRIEIGSRWVEEIERQLRASEFFVVLLSPDSIRSDMVRREIELAHRLEIAGALRILPVRVGFEGELPYDLAAYLNPIQYSLWQPDEPMSGILSEVVTAIENATALPLRRGEPHPEILHLSSPDEAPDAGMEPLPAAEPRLVMETGTVRLKSPFYIERAADAKMERAFDEIGVTLVVKGARQSGKSSLLARAHALANKTGRRSVYLDLQQLDDAHLESLDRLLRSLAARVARALQTEVRPADLWDEDFGSKASFADFLTRALQEDESPLLLVLDEVDRVFDRPYRGDFFAAVRGWHNRRATDPIWERLDLALGHATDPALWIDDLNQSPFNVGERLRLDDFNLDELAELDRRHGAPLRGNLEELRRLVGGQPYLVRQALFALTTERWTLAELVAVAAEESGPFGDHLRSLLWKLRRNERLCKAMEEVARGAGCADEMDFQRLRAAGLAAGDERRKARPRYELYRDYFRRHL